MKIRSPELRGLLRELRDLRVEVSYTGGGHLRVETPMGPVYMPSTPSDTGRGIRNCRAELRRHGVPVGRR